MTANRELLIKAEANQRVYIAKQDSNVTKADIESLIQKYNPDGKT